MLPWPRIIYACMAEKCPYVEGAYRNMATCPAHGTTLIAVGVKGSEPADWKPKADA